MRSNSRGACMEVPLRFQKFIVLLALVPRLIFGASQYIEYDGYWHVWIAQQDRWANFIREYKANAHPPLYFLLLRYTAWLGTTNLAIAKDIVEAHGGKIRVDSAEGRGASHLRCR